MMQLGAIFISFASFQLQPTDYQADHSTCFTQSFGHASHPNMFSQVAAIPEGGGGTHRLVAWELLTLGVAWSAALPLAALAAEPAGGGGGGSLVVAVSGGCADKLLGTLRGKNISGIDSI